METLDRRKIIHDLIDKLLDIEALSRKKVFFGYSGFVDSFDFRIVKNEKAYNEKLLPSINLYFNDSFGLTQKKIQEHIDKIIETSLIEDGPVEEMVSVQISQSRAKELGLIA